MRIASILLGGLFAVHAALAAGPTAADTAQAIRDIDLDPDACYRVRDLSYFKEDIKLYFNEGYLIFSRPVLGERLSAVFSADLEGGDGEIILLPPTRVERQSLAKFTKAPNLNEHFGTAILIFSDGAGTALLERITKEGAGRKVPELGPVLAERWNSVVHNVRESFTMRLVQDLLNPVRYGGGFFVGTFAGKTLGNFDIVYEPRGTDQILAAQLRENDRSAYDIWTRFEARSHRTGAAKTPEPELTVDQVRIEASLDADLNLNAITRSTIRIGTGGLRIMPFEVSRAMQVTEVKIDGAPAEILLTESQRGRALYPGDNAVFLVAAGEVLAPGTTHEIEFAHLGKVISSPGKGVYYVGARSNWYPGVGNTFATFDLTFRYPRNLTLVTPGDVVDDHTDGEWRTTRRQTPRIRMAGFNLGEYEKVAVNPPGFVIEVYGNRSLEPALRPQPRQTIVVDPPRQTPRGMTRGEVTTIIQTPPAPDPLARLKIVASDVSAALQYYAGIYGPPPLKSLTVSPIPDTFGQGFPGLIYISTTAYLNAEERPPFARGSRQQVFFSDIIQAHEVAHQWWGNLIGPASYQDDWLMEAMAQYSALLWLEKKKGFKAVEDVLEDYREDLLKQDDAGNTMESAGPLTWGYRLESTPLSEAWRAITYEKGVWVIHMLRQRLGTERFLKMLGEIRRRYADKSISTANLQSIAKEFLPPKTSSDVIDTFFDNWVYSTGIPMLKLKSSVKGVAPSVRVTGSVEQKGVDSDFSVDIPVEITFAKGPSQTVWVRSSNEATPFSITLKQAPLKVSIPSRGYVLSGR